MVGEEIATDREQEFRERVDALRRRSWWLSSFDRSAAAEASALARSGGPDESLLFLRFAVDLHEGDSLGKTLCAIALEHDRQFEAVGLAETLYFRKPSLRTDGFAAVVVKRLTPPAPANAWERNLASAFLNTLLRKNRKLPHVWRHKARVHLDERKWVKATSSAEVAPSYDYTNVYTWLDSALLISQSKHPPNPRGPGVVSGLANTVAAACRGAVSAAPSERWVRKRAIEILTSIGGDKHASLAASGALGSTDGLRDLALSLCRLVIEDNLLE